MYAYEQESWRVYVNARPLSSTLVYMPATPSTFPPSQQVNNPLARIPNIARPILRRRLHIAHAPLDDTLIIMMTRLPTQRIQHPQPDLILLHHLLESLLQHLIVAEARALEVLRERGEVGQGVLADVLAPLAREDGGLLARGRVGADLGEVVLEVGLQRDDGRGERGRDARLHGADGGLVVFLDGLLGVEVEGGAAAGCGGGGYAGGVDDVGEVVGAGADVGAEVVFIEDDAEAAVTDFGARVMDLGVGGWFDGQDVGGAEVV